jgi:hypothetical protein
MKYHHVLVPLLLAASLVACKSGGAAAPHAASLDQEIELAPKQQAVFGPAGLTVEFVRVVEDSRCPTDVTCVWAGEVKVELSTWPDSAKAERHEITAGQQAMLGEFQLWVVKVEPERVSTREISADEYRVTLKMTHSK